MNVNRYNYRRHLVAARMCLETARGVYPHGWTENAFHYLRRTRAHLAAARAARLAYRAEEVRS